MSLSHEKFLLLCCSLFLSSPTTAVNGHLGEMATGTPLIKVGASRCGSLPLPSAALPAYFLNKSANFDNTMCDKNSGHDDAVVETFPVAIYVLLVSYFALVLVPYLDLLDVPIPMFMVK
jgi:hypothetical protein